MRDNTHASAAVGEEEWLGFVCKECGAPFAVHRSTTAAKTPEPVEPRLARACTGCGVTEDYELTYSAYLRGLLVSQRCGRKCYPVVTRSQSRRVLFGKGEMLCRFGTEGSEVQILSPRPFFLRRLARRLFLACPGWNRVLDNRHTPSIIAPASADFRFS